MFNHNGASFSIVIAPSFLKSTEVKSSEIYPSVDGNNQDKAR